MSLDVVPCPIFSTNHQGILREVNTHFLALVGGSRADWVGRSMQNFVPRYGQVFLQTHVWPMLLQDGAVTEIRLNVHNDSGGTLPVLVNAQRTEQTPEPVYQWVMFVTHQRARYEAELLQAREEAQRLAAQRARDETFLRTLTNAVPSMMAYWSRDLYCQFANQPYLDWLGKTAEQVLGLSMSEVLNPSLLAFNKPHVDAVLAGETQTFEREIIGAGGRVNHTLVHYVPDTDALGVVIGFYAVATNVTLIKEADAAIQLSASVFNAVSEGIMVTDAEGCMVLVNQAFTTITGYSECEALGQNPRMLQSGRQDAAFYQQMWANLLKDGRWQGDLWCRRKDGSLYREHLSINRIDDTQGKVVRYVGVFLDITDRHLREEQERRMALHDALTGLPNRRSLMECLHQLSVASLDETQTTALLFLDLDGFKAVNDRFGHAVGDEVLKTVAKRLLKICRSTDTVARLGGDEFVVLMTSLGDRASVEYVVYRIIEAINKPIPCLDTMGEVLARVGTSVGIALFPEHGCDGEQLLMQADQAMYAAKQRGKNCCCFAPSLPSVEQTGGA